VVHALEFVRTRTKHDQVAVLGWSLGALTAQLVAQRHPELVSDVILFGYPRRHDHVFAAGPPSDAEPARSKTTASAAAEDFIVPGAISQRAIDAFVKAALRHDPVKADWRALEQWNELEPSALNVPTLLIHAERDPYALASAQAQLFSRFGARDRTYVVVAGGDHAAHIENSGARFVHAVVSFLERPRLEN